MSDLFAQPLQALTALITLERSQAQTQTQLGWWGDAFRLQGSTVGSVWRSVLLITLWSTLIAVLDLEFGYRLALTNSITPLLSIVLGLLLVFRNGSAFARWDSGRQDFGALLSTVRSFSRVLWTLPAPAGAAPLSGRDVQAKRTAIRMAVAFVIATRRHFRKEYGTGFEDLIATLPVHFDRLAKTNGYGFSDDYSQRDEMREARQAREDDSNVSGVSIYSDARSHGFGPLPNEPDERTPLTSAEATLFNAFVSSPSLPLPLIIAHQLSLYVAHIKRKGQLEAIGPAGLAGLQNSVSTLVDLFTKVEQLSKVGIPLIYTCHLKQCVSLFLLTLPFTLVEVLGVKMVPACSLIAFTLIGIEYIAQELEMPFGIDPNDLPLDLLCASLRNEVEHMIGRLVLSGGEEWM